MHIFFTLIAVIILTAGIFINQKGNAPIFKISNTEQKQVLSEEYIQEEEDDKSVIQLTETLTPSAIISKTITPSPTPIDKSQVNDSYIYPGSHISNHANNTVELESQGNVDTITEWYKNVIHSHGLSVTSFVVTKTNDNVLNKLVGSSNNEKVMIEIQKNSGTSTVKIKISFES